VIHDDVFVAGIVPIPKCRSPGHVPVFTYFQGKTLSLNELHRM
jgi:hypothetical protein